MTSSSSSSSSSTTSERMITVASEDGKYFRVKQSVAVQSLPLKAMIEDECRNPHPVFPLENIDGDTVSVVLDYLNYKHDHPSADENRKKAFESRMVENKGFDELMGILFATNSLEINDLLKCVAKAIAKRMEGMSVEEIRRRFRVENDYTPEEEAQLFNP